MNIKRKSSSDKPTKKITSFNINIHRNEVFLFKRYIFHYKEINNNFRLAEGNVEYNISNYGKLKDKPFFELFLRLQLKNNEKYLPLIVKFQNLKATEWKVTLFINPREDSFMNYRKDKKFYSPLSQFFRSNTDISIGVCYKKDKTFDIKISDRKTIDKYVNTFKKILSSINTLLKNKKEIICYKIFKVKKTGKVIFENKYFNFRNFHIIYVGESGFEEVIAFCMDSKRPFVGRRIGKEIWEFDLLTIGLIVGLTMNINFIPLRYWHNEIFKELPYSSGAELKSNSKLLEYSKSLSEGKIINKDVIATGVIPQKIIENIDKFEKLNQNRRKKIIHALLMNIEAVKIYEESPYCGLTLLWFAFEGIALTKSAIKTKKSHCKKHKKNKMQLTCNDCRSDWSKKIGKLYNVYRFIITNIEPRNLKNHKDDLKKLLFFAYHKIRNPLTHEARVKHFRLGLYDDLNKIHEEANNEKVLEVFLALNNFFLITTSRWLEKQ